MNSEFGKKEGFKGWFESRKPSSEIRKFLKEINDVRVDLTKSTPIKTRTSVNVVVRKEDLTPEVMYYLKPENNHLVTLEPIDKTNTEFYIRVGGKIIAKGYLENAKHEIPTFKGQDAREVCKKYIEELEILVNECHSKFHS